MTIRIDDPGHVHGGGRRGAVRSTIALAAAAALAGMFLLAVITGAIESTMPRLRLARVPQTLVAATVLSALALVLVLA